MKNAVALGAWLVCVVAIFGCGDPSTVLGKECKENADCNVGAFNNGHCLGSMFTKSYCTKLCEKDADCAKEGVSCGTVEQTDKGPIMSTKQDAHYCTKK